MCLAKENRQHSKGSTIRMLNVCFRPKAYIQKISYAELEEHAIHFDFI